MFCQALNHFLHHSLFPFFTELGFSWQRSLVTSLENESCGNDRVPPGPARKPSPALDWSWTGTGTARLGLSFSQQKLKLFAGPKRILVQPWGGWLGLGLPLLPVHRSVDGDGHARCPLMVVHWAEDLLIKGVCFPEAQIVPTFANIGPVVPGRPISRPLCVSAATRQQKG